MQREFSEAKAFRDKESEKTSHIAELVVLPWLQPVAAKFKVTVEKWRSSHQISIAEFNELLSANEAYKRLYHELYKRKFDEDHLAGCKCGSCKFVWYRLWKEIELDVVGYANKNIVLCAEITTSNPATEIILKKLVQMERQATVLKNLRGMMLGFINKRRIDKKTVKTLINAHAKALPRVLELYKGGNFKVLFL